MEKNILSQLESLLLAVSKPLAIKDLSKFLSVKDKEVDQAIKDLQAKHNQDDNGIHVAVNNKKVQFTTNPKNAKILREYFKDQITSELTKPSLETLTIIAYRQPVSKEELEQIRGVNCSLILRNLLIRGFIEAQEEQFGLVTTYSLTMDFLQHLGVSSVQNLPDYEKLNSDESMQTLLQTQLVAEDKEVETNEESSLS
jgi:segregation and condensation protein B